MKFLKLNLFILIVFFKTGNLLSDGNTFNVDNIIIERKDNISVKQLAPNAFNEAFNKLISRILLKKDIPKVLNLNLSSVSELVSYYNITKNTDKEKNKAIFSVTFDREKLHDFFSKNGILYSIINEKDFYILPILIDENKILIFSDNFFYKNWTQNNNEDEQIEFILPQENIEIIQKINQSRGNLLSLELNSLFEEYSNKNVALVLISTITNTEKKIYLKTRVQGKIITNYFNLKNDGLDKNKFDEKIIIRIKEQIINIVKSQNLIDVRAPSFLNVKLDLSKSNLVLLKSKLKKINLIEDVIAYQFNKDYVSLKVKYLGKIDKIINELKKKGILLELDNEEWMIKSL